MYINNLLKTIENHLFEGLTLDYLAKDLNYSKYHISRCFNTIVGMSITKYIQSRRLTEAVKLLDKNHSITETALYCGFNSPAYFTKNFKSNFKITPRAYLSGKYYIQLVEKFTIGEKRMFNNLETLNQYIFNHINDHPNIEQVFATIEEALFITLEDVQVKYFACIALNDKDHILYHCILNLLTGSLTKRIIRNTEFIPTVTIGQMYKIDNKFYIDVYNNVSLTRKQAELIPCQPKQYRTDLCRFADKYFNRDHQSFETITNDEITSMKKNLSSIFVNNNLELKDAINKIDNLTLLRMFSNKVLLAYLINRKDHTLIVTILADLEKKSYHFDVEHNFYNFEEKASIEYKEGFYQVLLDNSYLATLNMITGDQFDLYNAPYKLVLEDGTEDIFSISLM